MAENNDNPKPENDNDNKNIDFTNIPINDLIKSAKAVESNLHTINSNIADPSTAKKVLLDIHKKIDSKDANETIIATCGLLQKGGTSKAMNNSSSFTHGNAKVTKQVLHDSCQKYKITARQLARTLASQIAEISISISLPGNQSKSYRLSNPDATPDELAWASDFQTFNSNCPEKVRNFLISNYVSRFSKKQ